MSSGILVAEKDIQDKILFDSRKVRPQIAVGRDPAHLNIFTTSGSAIASNVGNSFLAKENLLTIKHGLGYKPKVLVYYFGLSNSKYSVGKFFYNFGVADDYLFYRVDTQNFYIDHILDDTGATLGVTSTAPPTGAIRIKYSIFSNPVDNYTNPTLR